MICTFSNSCWNEMLMNVLEWPHVQRAVSNHSRGLKASTGRRWKRAKWNRHLCPHWQVNSRDGVGVVWLTLLSAGKRDWCVVLRPVLHQGRALHFAQLQTCQRKGSVAIRWLQLYQSKHDRMNATLITTQNFVSFFNDHRRCINCNIYWYTNCMLFY